MVPDLLEKAKLPIERRILEVGDYIISGKETVVVERKEVHDYISSLVDGRLNNELYNMSVNFNFGILLVEGFLTQALMYRKMKRQAYWASICGSFLKRASEGKEGLISIVCTEIPWDSALFLQELHNHLTTEEDLIRLPKIEKFRMSGDKVLLSVLMGIPSIGEVKAHNLMKRYRTLRNFLNCTRDDLLQVDGIGDVYAQRIMDALDKVYEE